MIQIAVPRYYKMFSTRFGAENYFHFTISFQEIRNLMPYQQKLFILSVISTSVTPVFFRIMVAVHTPRNTDMFVFHLVSSFYCNKYQHLSQNASFMLFMGEWLSNLNYSRLIANQISLSNGQGQTPNSGTRNTAWSLGQGHNRIVI